MSGNAVQQIFDEGAVRVDDGKAVAGGEVCDHHISNQCRFSHTGFAEDGHVLSALVLADQNRAVIAFSLSDEYLHWGNYNVLKRNQLFTQATDASEKAGEKR